MSRLTTITSSENIIWLAEGGALLTDGAKYEFRSNVDTLSALYDEFLSFYYSFSAFVILLGFRVFNFFTLFCFDLNNIFDNSRKTKMHISHPQYFRNHFFNKHSEHLTFIKLHAYGAWAFIYADADVYWSVIISLIKSDMLTNFLIEKKSDVTQIK